MRWLLRPPVLFLISAGLAITAAALALWPPGDGSLANRAVPRPVPAGDQEIVWLNPATSSTTWERFLSAMRRVQAERPALALQVDDRHAFPQQTTAVAEVALSVAGSPGRLWFRWYKLTADRKIHDWVEALARRTPAPLAIIGGGSSDRARELALRLQEARNRPAAGPSPLLLITTATADEVAAPDDPSRLVSLNDLYPERTYRFCFTNRQMAEAVTDFIWSQEELRPDTQPVYMAAWQDDPYSEDLADRFRAVLWSNAQRRRQGCSVTRLLAWTAGGLLGGGFPLGLVPEELGSPDAALSGPFWRASIPYSEGSFNMPNRPEAEAAEKLMLELDQHPEQCRPLLILPATSQPARRFLRGLMRSAPRRAPRFVVATGDSIEFNTIYRDRHVSWPIQDLPYALVLFCHRNPVDQEAFQPEKDGIATDPSGPTCTGTEDLLLYADIVDALVQSAFLTDGIVVHPDQLAANLRTASPQRFDAEGNRVSGTGEYVVSLQPVRAGERILSQASLQVYRGEPDGGRRWALVRALNVAYTRGRAFEGAGSEGDPWP